MNVRPEKTIVLTGAGGLIGTAVQSHLKGKAEVHPISFRKLVNVGWPVDTSSLWKGRKGSIATLVHLGGARLLGGEPFNTYEGLHANVCGTLLVLELARQWDCRLIFPSSAAVYGNATRYPTPETSPLQPTNLYGLTKVSGEALLDHYRRTYGLEAISVRIFDVFGDGLPKPGTYHGVVGAIIAAINAGRTPLIHGDGQQTRDFVHVDDVGRMISLLALASHVPQSVNCGSGSETEIRKVVEMAFAAAGRDPVLKFDRRADAGVRRSWADISRARTLGFSPTIELHTWFKSGACPVVRLAVSKNGGGRPPR